MQYLIGIFLLTFSNYVHDLLEGEISNPHDSIVILTIIFFVITFFTATQDVAVDGNFSKKNNRFKITFILDFN